MPSVVLIVAAEEVEVLKTEPGLDKDILVFPDSEAIKALQVITRERPQLVVLGRDFTDTERGAALVNTIRTDHALANCQIRVLAQASDYTHLVTRRAEAGLAPDTAVPGEPLPPDYLGTRETRRFGLDGEVEALVDGEPTTLVDLSQTGARVVGPTALRPHQRVRVVIGAEPDVIRCSALVVWVSFEPRGKGAPLYGAGVRFTGADPETIEAFCTRHRRH